MKKHWLYLKYVLRHKWYVLVECWKLRLYWQGITHDLSKFLPSEWFPYVDSFYAYPDKDKPFWVKDNFDHAWLKHQHRNPHHWQYWLLRRANGTVEALPMPVEYSWEMYADWVGAGKAQLGKKADVKDWWYKNKSKMELHSYTLAAIENRLGIRNADLNFVLRAATGEQFYCEVCGAKINYDDIKLAGGRARCSVCRLA